MSKLRFILPIRLTLRFVRLLKRIVRWLLLEAKVFALLHPQVVPFLPARLSSNLSPLTSNEWRIYKQLKAAIKKRQNKID